MEKITFCIPSKSNLRYLKTCIPSIRENAYRKDHDIIVFVDSDDDGTVEWLKENAAKWQVTYYINPELGKKLYGIGKAYDYCIEKSTTDIFMIFHADMMLGTHADYYAHSLLEHQTVVCSTRIEPPLHPNAGEKILRDFGIWPEDFNKQAFNSFVERAIKENEGKVTEGVFAPWMMYKEDFLKLGGHDPKLHSAREDSDVFNRMLLAGYNFKQPWQSLVYHLTGRGGQFQHGTITQEHSEKSLEWQKLMENSTREFIRKWGTSVNHTALMKPIVAPKYNIGIIINVGRSNLLTLLEPWCDTIYIKNYDLIASEYIAREQPNTSYNLSERIKPYDNEKNCEILLEVDGDVFMSEDFQIIQQLPQIIKQYGEPGRFQLGNMAVEIVQMNEYQNSLINLETNG
jgi:glycosyltransferase involved in cell wall biosynthesis